MHPFRTAVAALLTSTCLLAAATQVAHGTGSPAPVPATPPAPAAAAAGAAATQATQRDIAAYARTHDVSTTEALRRLRVQEAAGDLGARLADAEAGTFAGLWIEHAPRFRVVVRFTQDAQGTLARYVGTGALAGVAEARSAQVPLARLVAEQEAAYDRVRAAGVPASGSVDLQHNRAEVHVTAAGRTTALAALDAVPTTRSSRASGRVDVVTVTALPRPEAAVHGGLEIVGGGAVSTTGFTVRRASDGKLGVTAAGHAPNTGTVQTSSGGAATVFEAERAPSGPYDIQWHSSPGNTLSNVVRDSTSGTTRPITSVRLRASQAVGSSVCKFGRTTGYTCGTIDSTTLCNNGSCTYVRVAGRGVNLSEGGDSGGPWFYGDTAYGTHCIGMGDDSGYMPVDYISQGLGVSVVTTGSTGTPPPAAGVALYRDCSYGSLWRTLGVGSYVVQSANHALSSLRVPAGYRVTLYDGADLTGASITRTADDPCLVDDGWNDRVSSLRVERT